jgi:hypothetical protein
MTTSTCIESRELHEMEEPLSTNCRSSLPLKGPDMVLINNQGSHRNLQASHLAKRTFTIGCPCEDIGMAHALMGIGVCIAMQVPLLMSSVAPGSGTVPFSLKHGSLCWYACFCLPVSMRVLSVGWIANARGRCSGHSTPSMCSELVPPRGGL